MTQLIVAEGTLACFLRSPYLIGCPLALLSPHGAEAESQEKEPLSQLGKSRDCSAARMAQQIADGVGKSEEHDRGFPTEPTSS